MNHTKEPWRAKADPSYYGIVSEIYAMDKFIASLGGVCSPDEVEANARRIVACVNACADLTNKHLNAGVIYRLIALQGLVHFAFGVELNKESKSIDEIIKISNEIHKILVNGEDV